MNKNIVVILVAIVSMRESAANTLNVMLIVVDDLRPALSCYDKSAPYVTPNVDNLAQHGVRFNMAFAQQALCAPSRNSMLTSRRPDTTRLYDVHSYWRNVTPGNYTTLPQYFKENGYRTQSFGKVFHPGVSSNHNDDYPYSWSVPAYHPTTERYKNAPVCPNSDGSKSTNIRCPVELSQQPGGTLPDIETVYTVAEWVKERYSSNTTQPPFFIAVGLHKPHIPLKYPEQYLDLYPLSSINPAPDPVKPKGLPDIAWNPWTDLRWRDDIKRLNVSYPYGPMPRDYEILLRQSYYAATSYTDDLVGILLEALDLAGLMRNTAVLLVGDHGWALGEHQEWSKYSNYVQATRVPLILYLPTDDYNGAAMVPKYNNSTIKYLDGAVAPKHRSKSARRSKVKHQRSKFYIDPFTTTALKTGGNNTQRPSPVHKYFRHILRKFPNRQRARNRVRRGLATDALVELVDIFPTLVDVAGLKAVPRCGVNTTLVTLCTEGTSAEPLIRSLYGRPHNNMANRHGNSAKWKSAVFTQYPRPSLHPQNNSDQPRLEHIRYMGYSMITSTQYHYTEWVHFNTTTFTPQWSALIAAELYDWSTDPREDCNVANEERYREVRVELSNRLHKGWRDALPVT